MIFHALKQILIAIIFIVLGDSLIAISCACFFSLYVAVVSAFIFGTLWGVYVVSRALNGAFE